MDLLTRISGHFAASLQAKQRTLEVMGPQIARAADYLAQQFRQGKKVLVCGNGGSAADAQHFAAELVNRFEIERPGLPAIALTTDSSALTSIGNDDAFEQIFARQVQALGNTGDVLLAISTSGNSPNVLAAMAVARRMGMATVALTGGNGGRISRANHRPGHRDTRGGDHNRPHPGNSYSRDPLPVRWRGLAVVWKEQS
jgi:D-sedoheptulose 7-phosphate isomerase